jgi:cytoskeletal protein RodZ
MAGQYPDDDEQTPPWYNRTPAVLGASVAGMAMIGLLIAIVTFLSGQSDEQQAPLNFVEPSFSATATGSSTSTTTATITSTSPPVTTDIGTASSTTSSSTTSSSTTSSSDTSTSTEPSTSTRVTQSRPSNDGSAPGTTRRGPRTNVTRTLYPQP